MCWSTQPYFLLVHSKECDDVWPPIANVFNMERHFQSEIYKAGTNFMPLIQSSSKDFIERTTLSCIHSAGFIVKLGVRETLATGGEYSLPKTSPESLFDIFPLRSWAVPELAISLTFDPFSCCLLRIDLLVMVSVSHLHAIDDKDLVYLKEADQISIRVTNLSAKDFVSPLEPQPSEIWSIPPKVSGNPTLGIGPLTSNQNRTQVCANSLFIYLDSDIHTFGRSI